jgi:hypothetical protein
MTGGGKMRKKDPMRDFLEKKGCPEHILEGGLPGLVEPAGKCLWGSEVAEAEGWIPEKNWWYFSRPQKGDADFLAEIDDL